MVLLLFTQNPQKSQIIIGFIIGKSLLEQLVATCIHHVMSKDPKHSLCVASNAEIPVNK